MIYDFDDFGEWPFITDNLPNYYTRDDVLYNDIVAKYVNGEELDEDDIVLMHNDFKSVEDAEKWLDADIKRLFLESVEAAYKNGVLLKIETTKEE